MKNLTTPKRSEVAEKDKWDLSSLYKTEADWNADLEKLPGLTDKVAKYQSVIEDGENLTAEAFLEFLKAYSELDRLAAKIGHYAWLMKSTDSGDSENVERMGKFMIKAVDTSSKISWFEPAIMALPEDKLRSWIDPAGSTGKDFADYRVAIEKMLYMKSHILSEKEEKILSLLGESMGTANEGFSVLTNVDFDFGKITTPEGEKELTQSSYSQFLQSTDRKLREKAFRQFYSVFDNHKNTIATLYAGSVKQDVAMARIRGFNSAREAALYGDKVPVKVYDNLIDTLHKNFAPLHKFYSIVKKVLKVDDLRHYDVYVPLVSAVKKITPYNEAAEIIKEALQPLGTEYVDTLYDGLLNGWVDRYENKGKRSGAFSAGGFDGVPFMFLNYKPDVIRDLFTMVHEGGHSMHSWYSVRNNPYMSHSYTIFEAEVASTFNEELLFRHLIKNTDDPKMRAYLLSIHAGDILATLYRQTMFAEFEKITHAALESGTPLTVDFLRSEYRKLLEAYFGPEMKFEDVSDLEGLRIPHFYRAFYVYKYSTGISASLTLADRVLSGGASEKEDYFNFLKSGGSRYPIEALKVAGVDMASPEPIQAACNYFAKLVDDLEKALSQIK
ncbi:MAG: oligoendopeptidase F [Treponema sp.]|nr:MAG: oligoendopeptidase F [Treponema sp.]